MTYVSERMQVRMVYMHSSLYVYTVVRQWYS